MVLKSSIKVLVLIATFLFLSVQISALPRPTGFVSDHANVINSSDRQVIEALGREVQQKSGAEIALLTVRTIEPHASIEEFANEVFGRWGVGERGKDTGVLIVLSTDEREVRIEVGYGLEGAIPDGLAGSIMDRFMLPHFRNNDFSTGLRDGYMAVANVVANEFDFEITGAFMHSQRPAVSQTEVNPLSELLGVLVFFAIFLFLPGGRFLWLLFFLPPSRRGNFHRRSGFGSGFYGGGRGFSGGFGGGFGGFGGGFSGGGGASRRF
ncbi:MAG: TPM domain-containing protein [Spirochaetes bacterium]|nr:TPM domain-containing protein [Spirochaetota bacterium]